MIYQKITKIIADFENLLEGVRSGENLPDPERERFLHENDYLRWQVLLNAGLSALDPTLVDALRTKFSIPLRIGEQIMM